tara:strand:+ start:13339 stop:13530 length:192 start_codon:yes stop_codon:yes gene_type:complete
MAGRVTGNEILAMKKAVREQIPFERRDCPIDGTPLEKRDDGVLHCPFDGWTSPLVVSPRRRDC